MKLLQKLGHYIKECPKLKVEEVKESSMVVTDASPSSNAKLANLVQDGEWSFNVECACDPSL